MLSNIRHAAQPDRREHDRVPVHLDCLVTFSDRTASAIVRDISLGGARIEMPMITSLYDFRRLSTLHIRQVGLVRARPRWQQDREVGVEFLNPDLVRQAISRLIATSDPRSRIRPMGR